jgi:hypothetical protein
MQTSWRSWLGAWLKDVPRFRVALAEPVSTGSDPARGWSSLCNRIESMTPNRTGPGVQCDWEWGSDLQACKALPFLGRQLMARSLQDWPIRFATAPVCSTGPRVSVIIAHAGTDRLTQLRRTIAALFAQVDVTIDCIVIDQSREPIEAQLPAGVTYRHLAKTDIAAGWYKSWAYNIGARLATSEVLIFHDGDICAPERYAAEVYDTLTTRGYDAASLQRFLYYLNPTDTASVEQQNAFSLRETPERVYQNWKGGTIAVRREKFFALGGFDEGFVDWGGEDDEFYDRCRGVKHCRFGYLPFVHLWHPPQVDRKAADNRNITDVMPWRMGLSVTERMAELSQRQFGDLSAPDPRQSYKSRSVATGRP